MPTYPELNGKVAVISGAAGNLGLAVVKRLYDEGVKLALIDLHEDKLRERLAGVGVTDGAIVIGSTDLTRKADVEASIGRILTAYGRIDILLNIAGGFKADGPVHETDEATWDHMMTLNAKTAFLLSAAVARSMVAGSVKGRIINIGARAALTGLAGIAAYSASKSAVLRLTESMAAELLAHGITVNAVMPSVIDTPQNRASNPETDYSKWVTPESLAGVIAFLASDASQDISGALIPVYGRA
jgi:NAD(P)-dependent dehydrogenase (short-subunit alcohol dehydrogenase family)